MKPCTAAIYAEEPSRTGVLGVRCGRSATPEAGLALALGVVHVGVPQLLVVVDPMVGRAHQLVAVGVEDDEGGLVEDVTIAGPRQRHPLVVFGHKHEEGAGQLGGGARWYAASKLSDGHTPRVRLLDLAAGDVVESWLDVP